MEAKEIVGLLNKLFSLDADAAAKLVAHRVECSEALAGDDVPFVCSRSREGVINMGVVGFINAMAKHGTGYAAAVYDDDNKLTGFKVVGGG
ncbi:hypothetical protein ACEV60_03225 [Enterobacter ludwigii]|uniref:hypothetical protein n=1 Tax=Enterobacter cloacae complex TaxID=354276 RepID=UPI0023ECA645|nr:hypothetical protein [Enterobacter hormaechei]